MSQETPADWEFAVRDENAVGQDVGHGSHRSAPCRTTDGRFPPTTLVLLGIVSVQVGAAFAKQLFTIAGAAGTVTLRLVIRRRWC